jgi:uncharacterized protein DUF1707/cell wall-active antibiotic response 4TMS protein YvqF
MRPGQPVPVPAARNPGEVTRRDCGYLQGVPARNTPRDLKASDDDRERVLTLLDQAYADGRLTPEEHAQRLEEASSARTLGELAGLTTDLVASEQQPVRLDGTRPVAAVFSSQRREGRWVVPDRLAVAAVCGEAVLDFRTALLQTSRVIVYATVIAGRLEVLVPEGVTVEVTGTSVAGRYRGAVSRSRADEAELPAGSAAPGLPPLPVIEIRGLILGGKVQVIAPRRNRFPKIFPRRRR